jgi:hypothetical protein
VQLGAGSSPAGKSAGPVTGAAAVHLAHLGAGIREVIPLYQQPLTDTERILGPDYSLTKATSQQRASLYEASKIERPVTGSGKP